MSLFTDLRFLASLPVLLLLGLAALCWRFSGPAVAAVVLGIAVVVGLIAALWLYALSKSL